MTIEEIYKKRTQVRKFDLEKYPDKETVDQLIHLTFDLVPSKQNLMPYTVNVLGPDQSNEQTKETLYQLSQHSGTIANTNCFAPYVIVFSSRLCIPNTVVADAINKGMPFESCNFHSYQDPSALRRANIEVGMFATILTGLCMEKNIQVSYLLCYPAQKEEWYPLTFLDKEVPLFVMTIGYESLLHKRGKVEDKPMPDEVIKWI